MYTLYIEDIHGGQTHEHPFDDGELVIGRSREGSDIVLPADNVSRRHARLYTADHVCYIQDLDSANGVYVDGIRIRDVHELESSSRVRVGDYVLYVSYLTTEAPPADVKARLLSEDGEGTARTYNIAEIVSLIGRGKDTAVTIIDPSVSRVHAKLTIDGDDAFVLQDLRSANGTYVNDLRVDQKVLAFGDRVRFGNAEFVFQSLDRAGTSEATALPSDLTVGTQGDPALLLPEDPPRGRKWTMPLLLVLLLATAAALVVVLLDRSRPEREAPVIKEPVAIEESAPEETSPSEASPAPTAPPAPTTAEPTPDPAEIRQAAIAHSRDEALRATQERRWADAENAWKVVLGHQPDDGEAARALHDVREEKSNAARLSEAGEMRARHDYLAALAELSGIPAGSGYHAEAAILREEIRALQPGYLEAALAAARRRQWDEACTSLSRAIDIEPDAGAIPRRLKKKVRTLKRRCATRAKR